MKRSLALALAATIGFGAVACSDDDDEALSKEDYIDQANAICEATNAEMEPILDEFWSDAEGADPSNEEEADAFYTDISALLDELVPIIDEQVVDLRDLAPPEDDKEELDALFDDFDEAVAEMNQTATEAAAGDEDARRSMDGDDPTDAVNARAVEYGLTACGVAD